MDVLIYHEELAAGDFPDACIRCGAGDTELVSTVITTTIPIFGGSFQYQTLDLPFCPAHVKPPLISLNYPAAREFTAEGVVVKNAASEFADALDDHRRAARRRRKRRREAGEPGELPAALPVAPPPRKVGWHIWLLFGLACAAVVVVMSLAIAGFVLMTGSKPPPPPGGPPPGVAPQERLPGPGPLERPDIKGVPKFGPP